MNKPDNHIGENINPRYRYSFLLPYAERISLAEAYDGEADHEDTISILKELDQYYADFYRNKIPDKKGLKTLVEKPLEKDYPLLEHTWFTNNDEYKDGDYSPYSFAWEAGEYHNGPKCKLCDFGGCGHCDPEIYKDTSCAYEQAENKWYKDKSKLEKHNEEAKNYNEAIDEITAQFKESE